MEITKLRDIPNDQERGRVFESEVRKILPWSYRPVVSAISRAEQIDGVFEWNSWHFLMEAKAIKRPILPGDHNWEDFELKVRRREGAVIGMYVSLYPVSPGVVESAKELNKRGMCCIILDGKTFDGIEKNGVNISDVIRYLVLHAKITGKPVIEDVLQVARWQENDATAREIIRNFCRGISVGFLRFSESASHELLYIRREIDAHVESLANHFKPSSLSRTMKYRKRRSTASEELEFVTERTTPSYLCLIRDSSGAGKTTYAIQVALTEVPFFGIARAANEADSGNFKELLRALGDDYGLSILTSANQPIVLVVDSLDEANNIPGKKEEIHALLKDIAWLHEFARSKGFAAFPLLCVMTVREDYWRKWESLFEGMTPRPNQFRNLFTRFGREEFEMALGSYARVYHYDWSMEPSEENKSVLSLPFNLRVFSEANAYLNSVSFVDALDERVLGIFFNKKQESIVKRRVTVLTGEAFMTLMGMLAWQSIKKRSRILHRSDIKVMIHEEFPGLRHECEAIILLISSEGIISPDLSDSLRMIFRHSRFLEYLASYHLVREFTVNQETFDSNIDEVILSDVASIHRIHSYACSICQHHYPEYWDMLCGRYAGSSNYMLSALIRMRANIAAGIPLDDQSVALIRRSLSTRDAEVAWHSFFALCAKCNAGIDPAWLIESFSVAWKANVSNLNRWRLLDKMVAHQMLLEGTVIEMLSESNNPQEWEYFMGSVLSNKNLRKQFCLDYSQALARYNQSLNKRASLDWGHVKKLWRLLESGEEYVLGDV